MQQQEANINLDADLEGIISLARRHILVMNVKRIFIFIMLTLINSVHLISDPQSLMDEKSS